MTVYSHLGDTILTADAHLEQDVDDGDSEHAPVGADILPLPMADNLPLTSDLALMTHRHPADDDVQDDDDGVERQGRGAGCKSQLRRHHV